MTMSTTDHKLVLEDPSFQSIVEQSIAGVYVIQDQRFVYCNETWAGFLGYTRAEMTGLTLHELIPPDFLEESLSIFRRRISGELGGTRYVSPGLHKDGRRVYVEVHASRLDYRGRPAVVGVGIDVTENVRRDEELRQARRDLQELAAQINRDREAQRGQFARELHDVLGGLLASIKMDVRRIDRRVADAELKTIIAGLLEVTQEAIQTVRDMSEELRPSGLDHLGLQETLRRELLRFGTRYEIECEFACTEALPALRADRATSVYRIVQEGLNNIAKHAQARHVALRLAEAGGSFSLELRDDGMGLAGNVPRLDARGILGMRERARELGGSLELLALPAGGTRLHLLIPSAP